MFFFHGKTVGKTQKWLGEFTVTWCRKVTPSMKTIGYLVV